MKFDVKKGGWLLVAASVCVVLAGCGHSKRPSSTTNVARTTSTTAAVAFPPKNVTSTITVTDSTTAPPKVTTETETDGEDGSYVVTNAPSGDNSSYDASTRTTYDSITGNGAALNIETNVPIAPPDQTNSRETDILAQYVLSQAASADPRVASTTMLGRSAYQMQVQVNSPTLQFDTATVVVDQQTGLMLLVDTSKAGKPYMKWQVTSFDINPDMSKVSYVLNPTKGQTVNRSDDAYVDTQLDLAKQQVGYTPVVPQQVPTGYTLTRLMTHAGKGEPTGANDTNPQNQGVVIEQFNAPNLWGSLFVTTRLTNGSAAKWTDPLASLSGEFTGFSQPITLQAGAMAQASGELVVSPAESPHLWAAGPTLVMTDSGPYSVSALSAAANSLA